MAGVAVVVGLLVVVGRLPVLFGKLEVAVARLVAVAGMLEVAVAWLVAVAGMLQVTGWVGFLWVGAVAGLVLCWLAWWCLPGLAGLHGQCCWFPSPAPALGSWLSYAPLHSGSGSGILVSFQHGHLLPGLC